MSRSHGTSPDREVASRRGNELGFTLIELTVAMVIMGFLAAMGTGGWLRYQRTVEHRSAAQELVSALRNAQQASLAEAVTHCVAFNTADRSYTVYKFACGGAGTSIAGPIKTPSSRVTLSAPTFTQADASTANTVSFYPRGSATKGAVAVVRAGSTKTYTVSVEGLTGRVSLAG